MRRCAAATVALLLVSACNQGTGTPDSPTAPTGGTPAGQSVSYTAIGASDGIGFGGSAPCVPFTDCPNGTGYVQILSRQMAEGGRAVTHLNLSLPGAVLSPAIEQLAAAIGRPISPLAGNFIERQAPFVPTASTHITLFAGGNDTNTIGQAARAGHGGSDPNGFVDTQIRQWGNDLVDLVARIRTRAPNARVVALNLPNLAAAPYVSGYTTTEKQLMQRVAVGLSDQVNALTGRNVLVVDLMCDPRLLQASSYSSDGFHPNDTGYAIIAEKVLPALRDGTAAAPSTSCAQRTIF